MGRVARAVLCTACAALLCPSAASAQKSAFVDGLLRLSAALPAPYGDEAPQIAGAIETLSRALEEWDRSIAALEARVAAEAPRSAPADAVRLRTALATSYLERHRAADALREIDASLQLDPTRADLYLMRAASHDTLGDPARAALAYREAWQRDREDPVTAYYALRRGMLSAEESGRARATLLRAYAQVVARQEPDTVAPFMAVTLAASAAEPMVPLARYAPAYVLVARGAHGEAIATFRRLAAADPLVTDPAARLPAMRQASAAFRGGRLEDARTSLEAVLAAAPQSSEARRILGLVYWSAGRPVQGIASLEEAIALNPGDERARIALSRVFADLGRAGDADAALRQTLAALPDSLLAHWWLASSHADRNDVGPARRELERMDLEGIPRGRGAVYRSLGRLARVEGDFAGSIDAFARRVSLEPNDAAAHLDLAYAFLDRDETDAAIAELVATLLLAPREARAHAAIGRIQLTDGRPAEAQTALRRALELAPADYESRYALATALQQLGRPDEAAREREAFRRAQEQAIANRRSDIAREVTEEATRVGSEAAR